jgi:hypothetical protein
MPITKEKQYNKARCVIIFLGDALGGHRGQKFQQKIKTSTHGVPIVQRRIKVLGGIQVVTVQT